MSDCSFVVSDMSSFQFFCNTSRASLKKKKSCFQEKTIVLVLGLATGGLWKMHHWNEQRKIRTFSDLLEKGEISVVAEE
ncbi:putative cytochrome c oxidase subunit 5c [Rosa chinensis]|uniref:Putative cytochrome c oxidase subunit 5c n=1 Tax=Rosa chinensis TaxID=74649 RepID=A0A2P6QGH1_ROSCH|nr:putative cytochrome c oxidase subunit 5c [Rosa chinensis]